MKEERQPGKWLLKPYTVLVIVVLIAAMILGVVFACYHKITQQFCEERLRTLDAVSSKITISTYTHFNMQWTSLNYAVNILQVLESVSENDLFDEIHTIEGSLGLSRGDGMIYLFDDKGYYYGENGRIGLWGEQNVLQSSRQYSLCVTNLPKQETHLGDFMVFFCRLQEPRVMDGLTITHVALVRDIAIFDKDLEIGNYGDIDSSYIIRKNGTRIYYQSQNEVFTNVYNVLKALDKCQFEHGQTQNAIIQDIQLDKSGTAHMIYEGIDYIMAYQPLNISDWYAVYIVSLNSMSQDTRAFISETVLMIGGAGAALVVLGLMLLSLNSYRWRLKQKVVAEKLRAAVEESKRASRAKSDFLSRMSHDIRTPLNGIIGMTYIAQRNLEQPETVGDCLEKVRTSSDHLMSLISDVLDMSRIESGKTEIRCEPFLLDRIVKECADMIEGQTVNRGIDFRCDCSGIIHSSVQGDEKHLKQILMNILGNAVKFTPAGGVISLSVSECHADDAAGIYQFEICDTGIGMSADYLEHIFEPFSQETNGPKTDYEGSGLGMSIVKELVNQMNGEIKVESQKNEGSRFVVRLPLCTAPQKSEDGIQPEETGLCTLHGKVLLAEDGTVNREIAEYLLADAGMTVVSAENGQQAVDLFAASQLREFDAILMDIMMPEMDGLTAARVIRNMDRPDAKDIPIIAMTANAYREDEEKSKESGMTAHLTKPLDPDDILCVLKHLMNGETEKE